MDAQTTEQTPMDAFDAALTAESNYVEKPQADAQDEKPQPTRGADGKFTKAAEQETVTEDAKPVSEKPAEKKPRNDPQARIDQAIARQRDAERRAEEAERRAREIESRTPAPKAPDQPVAQPRVDRFPDYATFLQSKPDASLEEWMDARDEWRDSRRDAQVRERIESERAETTFKQKASAFGERFAKAAQTDAELPQRLDQRLLSVRPYSTLTAQDKALIRNISDPVERDAVAFRCFLADQWIESEHAIALLEHLSDPSEFQRLATLPPNLVIRELAKLEAGFGAAFRKDSGPAPKPQASQAKPPFKPLGTTPHGVADDDGSDDESLDAFIRRENAKDRKAGRL